MEVLWFYVAIALAVSDEVHSRLVWDYVRDFYIIFGGIISSALDSVMETWIVHETLEACFHFIFISCVFFSFKIGFLAALIHFLLDVSHSIVIRHMPWLPHRALHFVIESLFFIIIFGL